MPEKNEGTCEYCGGVFAKRSIARHLNACTSRTGKAETGCGMGDNPYLTVYVEGYKQYWMYLDVDAKSKLSDLDNYLRNMWLECCGHMSAFFIGGMSYDSHPEGGDKSMNVQVGKVLSEPGIKFTHEYDFGSTTTLQLKVISKRNGNKRTGNGSKIQLMARNTAPVFQCSYCSNNAEHTCCECIYDDEGFLCESCAETHQCGEEMLLPIVNSPRSGVCGYCG